MARLWPSALAVGLGIAALAISPAGQRCITWSDGSACDGTGSMILVAAGFALIAVGVLWWLWMFTRATDA